MEFHKLDDYLYHPKDVEKFYEHNIQCAYDKNNNKFEKFITDKIKKIIKKKINCHVIIRNDCINHTKMNIITILQNIKKTFYELEGINIDIHYRTITIKLFKPKKNKTKMDTYYIKKGKLTKLSFSKKIN
jgi:hypothetical protein